MYCLWMQCSYQDFALGGPRTLKIGAMQELKGFKVD